MQPNPRLSSKTLPKTDDGGVTQFVEVFPVKVDQLPPLTAYIVRLVEDSLSSSEFNRLGALFVTKLRTMHTGTWLWANSRVITDSPPPVIKLVELLHQLHTENYNVFGWIAALEEDYAWSATPEAISDYVMRGRIAALEKQIEADLANTAYGIKNTLVEREHRIRAWMVNNQPALSVAVITRLLYEPELKLYAKTLKDTEQLIGMWVADKTSTSSGEIIKIVGSLRENRERLLNLAQRDTMREIINAASEDTLVVRVQIGYQEYDFVADALRLLIRVEDAEKFHIKPQMIEQALSLKPAMRAQMIKVVSSVIKSANLIDHAYRSSDYPDLFVDSKPDANLAFGDGKVRPLDPDNLPKDFLKNGAHKRLPKFETNPIRIVVINTLSDEVDDFVEAIKRSMQREYGFKLELIRERKVRVVTQANLESAVRLLAKENADLVVVFLPDEEADDEDEAVGDRYARAQTIGRGIPCLILHEATMHKPEVMPDIVMGIIARAGNIPYLLHDPLTYADRVVGLHLVRQHKKDGEHLTGISRIYSSSGELIRAQIASSPQKDGKGIPPALMARLLPPDHIGERKVVLHHDGKLKREVMLSLQTWEKQTGATFLPVEIVRRGIPRLYSMKKVGGILPPEWGSTFRLNDNEAFLVTALAPGEITPLPLHIRTEAALSIENAIHSVMSFTLFHYGALRLPKLPVTIHNNDFLESAIMRGVMPIPLESTVPFWL